MALRAYPRFLMGGRFDESTPILCQRLKLVWPQSARDAAEASYLAEASSMTGKNAGVEQVGRDDIGEA